MKVTLQAFDVDTSLDRQKLLFPDPLHIPENKITLEELSAHNGKRKESVYISVRGFVYDVSAGASFYGPGGPYGSMAGNDATVALAKFSLDPSLLNQRWSTLDKLGEESLASYIKTFQRKYPCVGRLRND